MNAYTAFVVSQHMEVLQDEAAVRRLTRHDRPDLRQRIVSLAQTITEVTNAEADYSRSILPTLDAHRG
ncbi:MAG: hypothetical protein WEG56_11370 [Chloroflexota bacterium]